MHKEVTLIEVAGISPIEGGDVLLNAVHDHVAPGLGAQRAGPKREKNSLSSNQCIQGPWSPEPSASFATSWSMEIFMFPRTILLRTCIVIIISSFDV